MDYEMDFNAWIMDLKGWIMDTMLNIHTNNYIPQEVKDAWIELALTQNIENLYESTE